LWGYRFKIKSSSDDGLFAFKDEGMAGREATITIKATDSFSTVLSKYKKSMDDAGTATDNAGKKAKGAKKLFGDMSTEMKGMVAGIGLAGVVAFGQELNEIGVQANKAKTVFSQLTTELGGYDNVLARLRQTTGGVVDDTLLMESSNKLLLSGLAGNEDELNNVIELATKLGSAMGEDAATSIENFSLMLMNQSIPRLDSFGISGSKVREEINELIKTGQAANREEAFKMAVFAEGANALDQLGDSANVASSELAILETKVTNLMQQLGGQFATGVEATAGIVNVAGENNIFDVLEAARIAAYSESTGQSIDAVDENRRQQAIDESAERKLDEFQSVLDSVLDNGARLERMQENLVSGGQEYQQVIAGYQESWDRAGDAADQHEAKVARMISGSGYQYEQMIAGYQESWDRAGTAVDEHEAKVARMTAGSGYQYEQMIAGYQESWDRAGTAVDEHEAKVARMTAGSGYQYQQMIAGYQESWDRAGDAVDELAMAQEAISGFGADRSAFKDAYDGLSQTTIAGNGITFTNPDEVAELDGLLDQVNARVAELESLNAQGLIGDDELADAQAMADQFGRMADDARSMARSIEDLSLAELFGQGDGGQLAEAGDFIEGLIGDADIAGAFNDAFNLAAGSETEVSQAFESSIAPALAAMAETQGADAAAHYLEAYLEAIRTGQTAGMGQDELVGAGSGSIPVVMGPDGTLVPNNIFPQEEGGTEAFGFGGYGENGAFDVQPFMDGIEEVQTAMDDLSTTPIEADTSAAEEAVTGLEAMIQSIVDTAWSVTIDVEYNDPGSPGGAGGGSGSGGGDGARRNGGSVAGADPRTPAIPMG
jgi:hypothetical protein